jgi:hypothetical protein
MRFKGEVYIYAGLFTLDSDGKKKLKRFDIVIVYTVYSWTDKNVTVEHSQKGGIYAVDVNDLIHYEEFPEDVYASIVYNKHTNNGKKGR